MGTSRRQRTTRLILGLASAVATCTGPMVDRAFAAPPTTRPAIIPVLPSRIAVPNGLAQAKAEKTVKDVFGSYASAAVDQRAETAMRMIDQATATQDDPVARYVLLKDAGDLAAGAASASTAMQAADLLAQWYVVDVMELKVDLLRKAAFVVTAPETGEAVVDVGMTAADNAVTAGNYEYAMRLMIPTEAAARNAKDLPLIVVVLNRSSEIRWLQVENVRAKSAEQKLATTPTDLDANFTSGRFLCLGKNDWRTGLTRLARGSNPGFRAAAAAELANPAASDKQILAGDLWWDLGEKDLNGPQSFLRGRAAYWYDKALADTRFAGINRARIEKRMSSVPRIVGGASGPATVPASTRPAATKSVVPPAAPPEDSNVPAPPTPPVVGPTAPPPRTSTTPRPAPSGTTPAAGENIFSDRPNTTGKK